MLLHFPSTGFTPAAVPWQRSFAVQAVRKAVPLNKEKNPEKSNELGFSGFFSLFLYHGTLLAAMGKLAEASLFVRS